MGVVTAPSGTPAAILALLRAGPRQAQEIASDLGIDTSAARRHLEGLRADGYADTTDVIDGPGRPKKMYALTARGQETFPRDYALLLQLVLAKIPQKRDRRELESIMRLVAKDLAASIEGASSQERLRALLAFYNKLGFDAQIEKTSSGLCLRQRNCIFLKTARSDPSLMCECFDEGIMRAALPNATIELQGSLATGATHCTHLIRMQKADT